MFKKIKQLSITLASMLILTVPVLAPVSVHAAIGTDICTGVNTATGETDACTATTDTDSPLNRIIRTIINIFSIIVGAVSVIMIIYGGFKYITSGGNDTNVSSAKSTILYAVVGLIVVALAQVIVRFVLTQTGTAA